MSATAVWRPLPRVALLACLLCACAADAAGSRAGWVSGRITAVHDGDTATLVTREGRRIKVRFYGVDAPELATRQWPAQARAEEAARFMRELLLEREVAARLTGEKTYDRLVGEIFTDGRSASRELLRAGLGWWNARYAAKDSDLAQLQAAARRDKRGLWRDRDPVAPWEFRQRHR